MNQKVRNAISPFPFLLADGLTPHKCFLNVVSCPFQSFSSCWYSVVAESCRRRWRAAAERVLVVWVRTGRRAAARFNAEMGLKPESWWCEWLVISLFFTHAALTIRVLLSFLLAVTSWPPRGRIIHHTYFFLIFKMNEWKLIYCPEQKFFSQFRLAEESAIKTG